MKEMDSIIADIDGVLAMSGEGGEYEKLIQKSVTANKEKLSQMKAYANNPSIPAAQRAVIERKIPQFESPCRVFVSVFAWLPRLRSMTLLPDLLKAPR